MRDDTAKIIRRSSLIIDQISKAQFPVKAKQDEMSLIQIQSENIKNGSYHKKYEKTHLINQAFIGCFNHLQNLPIKG